MNEKRTEKKQGQSITNKLYAHVSISGVEDLKDVSADSTLEIETTCTGKTSVDINLLKS